MVANKDTVFDLGEVSKKKCVPLLRSYRRQHDSIKRKGERTE